MYLNTKLAFQIPFNTAVTQYLTPYLRDIRKPLDNCGHIRL